MPYASCGIRLVCFIIYNLLKHNLASTGIEGVKKKKKKLSACRGEGSVVGLQLRCACALCLLRCWLC
jgi:hypothetical protein